MGADNQPTSPCCLSQGRVKIAGLIERQPFFMVANGEIHTLRNQIAKIIAVPVHTKRIRQGDPHFAPARAAGLTCKGKGGLAFGLIIEIALQKHPARGFGSVDIHIRLVKISACPKICIHRALTIW